MTGAVRAAIQRVRPTVVLGTLALLGCGGGAALQEEGLQNPAPPSRPSGSGELGAVPDPGWRLRSLDGREITLGDTRGAPVVVNLWATWCPPCVDELASIDRLSERVADLDVAFLLVSPEAPGPVRDFLARRPLGVPVYLEGTLAPEAFGSIVLPTTYILDGNGAIRLQHRGASDWDSPEVEALLRALAREAGS